jgi:hypothetical protein
MVGVYDTTALSCATHNTNNLVRYVAFYHQPITINQKDKPKG